MILRFSRKLGSRLKAGTLKPLPMDDAPVADWTSHVFFFKRTPYILVTNTAALYSTVLYAKGITSDSAFISRALSELREFMEADGLAFAYERFIAPRTGVVRFASSLNRSVTGSMNELIACAKVLLARDELSPSDLGFQLNDLLLSAIASADRPPLRQAPGSIPGLDRGVASIMKVANDFQQIPATVGDILIDRPRRNILRRQRSGGAG